MPNPLWTPSHKLMADSNMDMLRRKLNDNFNLNLTNYYDLHNWSTNNVERFWEHFWFIL